jgi:hypothetical membrane protein
MRRSRQTAVALARFAILGIVVYVALDVALVFLRPHFSVLHNAESDYGASGSYAWVMDLNFLLRGAFSLAVVRALVLAGALRGRGASAAHRGLTIWALASGALAFFPDDPVGTRTHGLGAVHLALAGVAFVAVLVGTIAGSRAARVAGLLRSRATALRILAGGALVPVLLLAHAKLRLHSLGGLYEKLFLAVEIVWLFVVAWAILRAPQAADQAAAAPRLKPGRPGRRGCVAGRRQFPPSRPARPRRRRRDQRRCRAAAQRRRSTTASSTARVRSRPPR